MVVCPPHTTERKLITKIDLHVVPFLCIMYLLAFLDRVSRPTKHTREPVCPQPEEDISLAWLRHARGSSPYYLVSN